LSAYSGSAQPYCRTTTCSLPAFFSPTPDACYPDGFAEYCRSLPTPARTFPVWWSSACVSYDLQRSGTRQIALNTVSGIVAAAFAKWTGTTCATDGSGASRVSIDVRDLGPVDCNKVQYNTDQPNQHVILFHDDVWPYDDANNTLGLTTVTFDPDSGEIYDADMEINATVPLSVGDPVPPTGYDFDSIVTHEAGHFLGMAHSGDDRATMFAHYSPGTSTMRVLTDDDVKGVCNIYPPGGARSVDPSIPGANKAGLIGEAACDPTPRHGYSTQCAASSKTTTCTASIGTTGTTTAASGSSGCAGLLGSAAALLGLALRAGHRRRASISRARG
jgi:hypothetical protein